MKKIIKYGLIAIPGLIGFYGFLQLNAMTYSQALYSTIHLYSFSTDTEEINGFIEVARWLAPIATAAFLAIIFQNIRESITNSWRTLNDGSVTVYGEGLEAEMFLSHLGSKGVRESSIRFQKHVIKSLCSRMIKKRLSIIVQMKPNLRHIQSTYHCNYLTLTI